MVCGIWYENGIHSVFAYVSHASHSGCLQRSASIPCFIFTTFKRPNNIVDIHLVQVFTIRSSGPTIVYPSSKQFHVYDNFDTDLLFKSTGYCNTV